MVIGFIIGSRKDIRFRDGRELKAKMKAFRSNT